MCYFAEFNSYLYHFCRNTCEEFLLTFLYKYLATTFNYRINLHSESRSLYILTDGIRLVFRLDMGTLDFAVFCLSSQLYGSLAYLKHIFDSYNRDRVSV